MSEAPDAAVTGLPTGRVLDGSIASTLFYLERHLHERVRVQELAAAVGLSIPHLRARLREQLEEPLARHLRRLRLERAKLALTYSAQPVIEIALACGFDSHEGFTRAFKRAYGLPPADLRAEVRALVREGPAELPRPDLRVELVERPLIRVACIRWIGARALAWKATVRLFELLRSQGIASPGAKIVGIHYDDDTVANPLRLRYDAGVEIRAGASVGRPFAVQELPAGLDAVVRAHGPLPEIEAAWHRFTRGWLLGNSAYTWRDDRFFDVYHGPPAPWQHPERVAEAVQTGLDVELHIPVARGGFAAEPATSG